MSLFPNIFEIGRESSARRFNSALLLQQQQQNEFLLSQVDEQIRGGTEGIRGIAETQNELMRTLAESTSALAEAQELIADELQDANTRSTDQTAILTRLTDVVSGFTDSINELQRLVLDNRSLPGEIKGTFGAVPDGWVECDGREILIEGAEALFGAIGHSYTAGMPEGRFRIPAKFDLTTHTGLLANSAFRYIIKFR